MNLAQSVQDFVQARWSLFAAFKWLLLLTGSRAPESGVDRCVVRILFLVSMLVFIASWLLVALPDFGCAWVNVGDIAYRELISQPMIRGKSASLSAYRPIYRHIG